VKNWVSTALIRQLPTARVWIVAGRPHAVIGYTDPANRFLIQQRLLASLRPPTSVRRVLIKRAASIKRSKRVEGLPDAWCLTEMSGNGGLSFPFFPRR
jgi:hypothetical protein